MNPVLFPPAAISFSPYLAAAEPSSMATTLTEPVQPGHVKADKKKGREFQPPFVQIDGLNNFRDIGGWPICSASSPNSKVRSGILYRGPDLGSITEKGTQQLKDAGVEVIFDIRSVPQIVRAGGVKEIEGIKRVWCPVFEESEYTPEKAGTRYTQYSSDGTDVCSPNFIFSFLSHCYIYHSRLRNYWWVEG